MLPSLCCWGCDFVSSPIARAGLFRRRKPSRLVAGACGYRRRCSADFDTLAVDRRVDAVGMLSPAHTHGRLRRKRSLIIAGVCSPVLRWRQRESFQRVAGSRNARLRNIKFRPRVEQLSQQRATSMRRRGARREGSAHAVARVGALAGFYVVRRLSPHTRTRDASDRTKPARRLSRPARCSRTGFRRLVLERYGSLSTLVHGLPTASAEHDYAALLSLRVGSSAAAELDRGGHRSS